ncbi:ComF family protein [Mycolicibacterium sp. BiH015]|uniref:ComF family protein n=1 Tax=Mycolicibacterium sp. BiH015 TaxID=3018808 RepID=UPI0022E9297F|nr:amidophosphoribosyltransferase [Mycolicibacterium sp. BiH015]
MAPLVYAVAGEASARHLSGYKNCPQRRDRDRHADVVAALLASGLHHEPCVVASVGIPISAYAVVPSLTSRPGRHPLTAIASSLRPIDEQLLAATLDSPCDRTIRLDKFTVGSPEAVCARHVAVIDDVWTTGANAQSAALTMRRAGAAAVSVLVVGRWIDPRHPATGRFVAHRQWASYDPLQCPVNVQRCRVSTERALIA